MEKTQEEIIINFNQRESRSIALNEGNIIGYCQYKEENNIWSITHTVVKQEFGGRGIAKRLVIAVIEEARKQNKKINPICSYAKKMMESSDEYKDVLNQ
jgi:predicted GNAT family acetyltransferase